MSILDCTIRDGGYINNWNFTNEHVIELYKVLNKCDIKYMEIGFLENSDTKYNSKTKGKWRSINEELIKELMTPILSKTELAVMINYGYHDLKLVPAKSDSSIISLYRVAFHQKDIEEAMSYISELKKKGYVVSANAMGIINYTDEELLYLCDTVCANDIDYLYVADSYGSLTNNTLKSLITKIKSALFDKTFVPKLGFHAHNNTQRALSNALLCNEYNFDLIDTTMYGMGRGAGNLCTELYLSELFHQGITTYTNKHIHKCVQYIFNHILKDKSYNTYTWGYDIIYFITGHLNIHQNYGWKIKEYYISNIDVIWDILYIISKSDYSNKFNLTFIEDLITSKLT